MHILEILNKEIKENDFKSYLEIGIFRGDTFFQLDCDFKVGVDPFPMIDLKTFYNNQFDRCWYLVPFKSDDFFESVIERREVFCRKYDLVFIDGHHEFYQALKDLKHSLDVLSDGGVIYIHDVCPRTEAASTDYDDLTDKQYMYKNEWNGDVWKLLAYMKDSGMTYEFIDVPQGLIKVKKQPFKDLDSGAKIKCKKLDWAYFEAHREELKKRRVEC